jgi:hypothetical protein
VVHVAPAPHRDVISQHLQRHHLENRQQQFVGDADVDHMVGDLGHFRVAFAGHRHKPAADVLADPVLTLLGYMSLTQLIKVWVLRKKWI